MAKTRRTNRQRSTVTKRAAVKNYKPRLTTNKTTKCKKPKNTVTQCEEPQQQAQQQAPQNNTMAALAVVSDKTVAGVLYIAESFNKLTPKEYICMGLILDYVYSKRLLGTESDFTYTFSTTTRVSSMKLIAQFIGCRGYGVAVGEDRGAKQLTVWWTAASRSNVQASFQVIHEFDRDILEEIPC